MNDFYEFHKNEIALEFPFRIGIAGMGEHCFKKFLGTIQVLRDQGWCRGGG